MIRLPKTRESELVELSEDVAVSDCKEGPVCPKRICNKKGLEIIYDNYGPNQFDGMLVRKHQDWYVLCNCDRGNQPGGPRERFTIAHELGHYHIPEHRRQLIAGCKPHGSRAGAFDGKGSKEELEADTFAANLLMPPARFVPCLRACRGRPLKSVVRLSKEFSTSLESTAIQTMKHNSSVVAVAKWTSEGLGWHLISDPYFWEKGYRKFKFRDVDFLPDGCATEAALNQTDVGYENTIHDSVLSSAYCFDFVDSYGKRDILLQEQAIRNGRFGVLTVYSVHASN